MKTEDVLVGRIRISTGPLNMDDIEIDKHALLFRFGEGNAWYYSPKYHEILAAKPFAAGNKYVDEVRLLDFEGLQKKDRIFKLKVYNIYRKFLQDIVNPADFMLIDVCEYGENKNVVTRHCDVLVENISDETYDFGERFGVMNLRESGTRFEFGALRPFEYGDLISQSHVTREEMQKTYRLYLEDKAKRNN